MSTMAQFLAQKTSFPFPQCGVMKAGHTEDVMVQMIMPEGAGVLGIADETETSVEGAGAGVCASGSVGVVVVRGSGGGGGGGSAVECGRQLLLAARAGDTDTVRKLMTMGAPFTADWLGTTPLHLAAGGGHVDTLTALLRGGLSRDSRTKVDRTAMHLAATHGHDRCVAALIGAGAMVDARDLLRMTPLHWAVEKGHLQTAKLLLAAGADPHAESKFLKTPLSLAQAAAHRGRPALLRAIEAALADRSVAHIHPRLAVARVIFSYIENTYFTALGVEFVKNPFLGDDAAIKTIEEAVENTTSPPPDTKTYMIQQDAVNNTTLRIEQATEVPEPVVGTQPSSEEDGIDGNAPCVHVESEGEAGGEDGGAGQEGLSGEGEGSSAEGVGVGVGEGEGVGEGVGVGAEGAAALLRRHGITLLPPDDGGTLLSALSSGRSIVLSDAGKLMLKESGTHESSVTPRGGGGVLVRATPAPMAQPTGKVFTLAAGARVVRPRTQTQKPDVQQVKLVQLASDIEKKPSTGSTDQPVSGQVPQGATQGGQGGPGGQSARPAVRIIMNKHNFRKLIATATRASANDNGLLTEEDLELDSESEDSGGESGGDGGEMRGERRGGGGESVVTVPEQFVRSGSAQYLRSQLLCAHAAIHHLAHRLRTAKHKLKRLQHSYNSTNNNNNTRTY